MTDQIIKINNSSISFNPSNGEIADLVLDGNSLLKNKQDSTWPRVWPIMFPFCGRLYKNEFKLDDKVYRINKINGKEWENKLHGFYDQLEWNVKTGDNKLICESINTIDKSIWPHDFTIIHTLEIFDNKANIKTEIKNNGNNTMYFNYGHHGAFELSKKNPLIETELTGTYKRNKTKYCVPENEECFKGDKIEVKKLHFSDGSFYQDTNFKSSFVKIPRDKFNVILKTDGFDTFTFCKSDDERSWMYIEFWKGFQDFESDMNKDITKKPQIVSLKSKQSQFFNISIELERN